MYAAATSTQHIFLAAADEISVRWLAPELDEVCSEFLHCARVQFHSNNFHWVGDAVYLIPSIANLCNYQQRRLMSRYAAAPTHLHFHSVARS